MTASTALIERKSGGARSSAAGGSATTLTSMSQLMSRPRGSPGVGGGALTVANGAKSSQLSQMEREQLKKDLDEIDRGLACTCGPDCQGGMGEGSSTCQQLSAEVQLQTAKKLRDLLSVHRDILIHEIVERNWVQRLLQWLNLTDLPAVQVEALWALTNIAAGTTEHTHTLLKHNPVPSLVRLLESSNYEVVEQSVWVIGNIAGEGAPARDAVLTAGALRPLVQCIQRHVDRQQILRIGSWAINNLCDGQPRPTLDIHVVMPVLKLLLGSEDSEVLSHTCWALSHLCDGPSTHIKVVMDANICWRLVDLLKHRSWRVVKPALRTIGNIVCAEDEVDYTQHIIDAGAVPCLRELIAHSNREIQKEACWTLSNIAAGTCDQIQTVLDSGSIPLLVQLASAPATDAEVRSEACWVVLNATACGSDRQIEYLVREGCITVLGDLLGEANMVMMALEGLERILQVGDEQARRRMGSNPYAHLLSSAKIEDLESHKSAAVAKRAARIWKTHFVTCAICSKSFSKHSREVGFCPECKCYVCVQCNCAVFHLSYQEELWKEMSVKEASAKEAQQVSKRNRKAKKKQKEREKKAQAKEKLVVVDLPPALKDPGAEMRASPDGAGSSPDRESKSPLSAEAFISLLPREHSRMQHDGLPSPSTIRMSRTPSPPSSPSVISPSSTTHTGGRSPPSRERRGKGGAMKRSRARLESEPAQDGGAAATDRAEVRRSGLTASGGSPPHMEVPEQSRMNGGGKTGNGVIPDARAAGEAKGKRGRARDGAATAVKQQAVDAGIDLVDYLQTTGSILALSKFLDEQGDGDDSRESSGGMV